MYMYDLYSSLQVLPRGVWRARLHVSHESYPSILPTPDGTPNDTTELSFKAAHVLFMCVHKLRSVGGLKYSKCCNYSSPLCQPGQ